MGKEAEDSEKHNLQSNDKKEKHDDRWVFSLGPSSLLSSTDKIPDMNNKKESGLTQILQKAPKLNYSNNSDLFVLIKSTQCR